MAKNGLCIYVLNFEKMKGAESIYEQKDLIDTCRVIVLYTPFMLLYSST